MSRQLVRLSINLDQIDLTKIIPGKKGQYIDATLFLNDAPDQYGNHGFIAQSVSKEDREAGIRGPIIGNAKIAQKNPVQTQYPAPRPVINPNPTQKTVDPEDLPF